jgi:hypothetical protein
MIQQGINFNIGRLRHGNLANHQWLSFYIFQCMKISDNIIMQDY